MSILSSQADPPTLKNLGFMIAAARFSKNKASDLKMLLMVFGGSLGLILGALGGFLGALLVLLRAFGGTTNSQNFFLDFLPGQIYWSCLYLLSLPSSKSLFSSSLSLSVSILSSQADPPTLKNLDFALAGARK